MAKILVVEDNPTNLRLTLMLLRTQGHEALGASDAESGLELAGREVPDLILMDVQLPGMSGLEATARLKQNPALCLIPVIALTGLASADDQRQVREAGCVDYLGKPFRSQDMVAKISLVLRTGALEDCFHRSAANPTFYRSLLLGFAERLQGLDEEFGTALARLDRKRIQFLAHSLQGEAGNLGASEVARQATALGEVARNDTDDHLSLAVSNLLLAISATREELVRHLSLANDETHLAGMEWSAQQLTETRRAFANLAGFLEANAAESLYSFHELRSASPTLAGSGQLEELERLVLKFEFDQALQELRSLEARLPLQV